MPEARVVRQRPTTHASSWRSLRGRCVRHIRRRASSIRRSRLSRSRSSSTPCAPPRNQQFQLMHDPAVFDRAERAITARLDARRADPLPRGSRARGIFDFADERNPFADYSVVFVPYCTADVHIGNATTKYGPGLTVYHKGYLNGTAALDHLAATFPGATDIVVIGESAGSIAAPLYAGLVSDRLADARITVLADGSGAYPDGPEITNLVAPSGAPATPSRAGPRKPAWPTSGGASRGSSSRAAGTTRRSSSPATTTPTTRSRPPSSSASLRRILYR
jgi:hypothetical protein